MNPDHMRRRDELLNTTVDQHLRRAAKLATADTSDMTTAMYALRHQAVTVELLWAAAKALTTGGSDGRR